jgi:hypothetical protein
MRPQEADTGTIRAPNNQQYNVGWQYRSSRMTSPFTSGVYNFSHHTQQWRKKLMFNGVGMTLEPKTYMGALIPCFINVLSIHNWI